MMELSGWRSPLDSAFDEMLNGCRRWVTRIMELHPTDEHDDVYVFILWVDIDRHDDCLRILTENVISVTAHVKSLTDGLIAVTEVM